MQLKRLSSPMRHLNTLAKYGLVVHGCDKWIMWLFSNEIHHFTKDWKSFEEKIQYMSDFIETVLRGMFIVIQLVIGAAIVIGACIAPATLAVNTGSALWFFLYIPHALVIFYTIGME